MYAHQPRNFAITLGGGSQQRCDLIQSDHGQPLLPTDAHAHNLPESVQTGLHHELSLQHTRESSTRGASAKRGVRGADTRWLVPSTDHERGRGRQHIRDQVPRLRRLHDAGQQQSASDPRRLPAATLPGHRVRPGQRLARRWSRDVVRRGETVCSADDDQPDIAGPGLRLHRHRTASHLPVQHSVLPVPH